MLSWSGSYCLNGRINVHKLSMGYYVSQKGLDQAADFGKLHSESSFLCSGVSDVSKTLPATVPARHYELHEAALPDLCSTLLLMEAAL